MKLRYVYRTFCLISLLCGMFSSSCRSVSSQPPSISSRIAKHYEALALEELRLFGYTRSRDFSRRISMQLSRKPVSQLKVSVPTVDSLQIKGLLVVRFEPSSISTEKHPPL